MVSAVHTFGLVPVLIVLTVAVLIGLGIRFAMHRRNVKWSMSERSQAITSWATAAIAFVIAGVFLIFMFNAAGIAVAMLYVALGALFIAVGRKHWARQTSEQGH